MDVKGERCSRADRQEEGEVLIQRKTGAWAYRIDNKVDTISIRDGVIYLCDCKFSDQDVCYIDSSDIGKGLDEAAKVRDQLNSPAILSVVVKFRIDMYFPRVRVNNRRYINIQEEDRGWSYKVWKTDRKIMTQRVKRGSVQECGK